MAIQTGVHKMRGTVDGLTYYKTAESGLLVRKKSSLDKERVSKDPAFAESRKAYAEFGRASLAAKLVRAKMEIAGFELGDTRVYSRLTGRLKKVITTDTVHEKGERLLADADLNGLVGFEWNKYQKFGNLYNGKVKFAIDAKGGLMEVDTLAINGPKDFDPPTSATHVQLVLEGAAFDFGLGEGVGVVDTTKWLSLEKKHSVQTLSGMLAIKPGMRLVLGIGIRFGQEVSGAVEVLYNRLYRGFVVGAVK